MKKTELSGFVTVSMLVILSSVTLALLVMIEAASACAARSVAETVSLTIGRSLLAEYNVSLREKYGIFAVRADEFRLEAIAEYYYDRNLPVRGPVSLTLDNVTVDCGPGGRDVSGFAKQVSALGAAMAAEKLSGSGLIGGAVSLLMPGMNAGSSRFSESEYILGTCSDLLGAPEDGAAMAGECEYIICGGGSDEANRTGIRLRIFGMRLPVNIIKVYEDPQLMAEAELLAAAMAPLPYAAALPIAVTAIASDMSESDIAVLFSGGIAPLTDHYPKFGSYRDHLRMLLLAESETRAMNRLMDIMERRLGEGFRFEDHCFGFGLTADISKKVYMLDRLGLSVKDGTVDQTHRYR